MKANLKISLFATLFIFCLAGCSGEKSKAEVEEKAQPVENKTTQVKKKPAKKNTAQIPYRKKEIKKILGSKTFKAYNKVAVKFNKKKKDLLSKDNWNGAKNQDNRKAWLAEREKAIIEAIGNENYLKISKPK